MRYQLINYTPIEGDVKWFVRDTVKSTNVSEYGFDVPSKKDGEKLSKFLNQQINQLEKTQKLNFKLNNELHTIYKLLDEHIIYYEQGPVMWMKYAEDGLKEFKQHIRDELK